MRSSAASYARRSLRINAVAPGLVETPLAAALTFNDRTKQASAKLHALGRIGQPADISSAICWLLDPDNTWVTGTTIHVDGGLARLK